MEKMKEQKYDLIIGVPSSSRLTCGSELLLKNTGIVYQKSKRALTADGNLGNELNLKLVFTRPSTIVKRVESGDLDLGIAGQDVVKESKVNVAELTTLGFGRCRLMVAIPKVNIRTDIQPNLNFLCGKSIATTYPVITKDFFDQRRIPILTVWAEGGVEALAAMGWTDAIVDVVETGNSLTENSLVALDTVFESEAELIANLNLIQQKGKRRILDILLRQIDQAVKLPTNE